MENAIPAWLSVVAFIITLTASGIAVYVALRRAPFDIRKSRNEVRDQEVDTAANLQRIADLATTENLKLREELQKRDNEIDRRDREYDAAVVSLRKDFSTLRETYDKEISSLKEAHEREMQEIKKSLLASQEEAKRWRDYSTRLIEQMHSVIPDVTPVPFEPRKSRSSTQGGNA